MFDLQGLAKNISKSFFLATTSKDVCQYQVRNNFELSSLEPYSHFAFAHTLKALTLDIVFGSVNGLLSASAFILCCEI